MLHRKHKAGDEITITINGVQGTIFLRSIGHAKVEAQYIFPKAFDIKILSKKRARRPRRKGPSKKWLKEKEHIDSLKRS